MRIFTPTAAAAAMLLSVAAAFAHEPPEWVSDVKDDGGPPAWVDAIKTDGAPPAFVETAGGAVDENSETDEDVAADASEGTTGQDNANVPEWVADVKADGGPPAWVEDVNAAGGPPAWVEDVRTTRAAAAPAAQKKAGH